MQLNNSSNQSVLQQKPTHSLRNWLLFVFFLFIIVGAMAWWYLNNPGNTGSNGNFTPAKKVSETQVNHAVKTNYLTISEWAVKVPETPAGNTISYRMDTPDLATFVSSEQKALGGQCGTFEFARYHVSRTKPEQPAVAQEASTVMIAGTTYYIEGDMTGGVCNDQAATGQAETKANADLLNALKGMVPR